MDRLGFPEPLPGHFYRKNGDSYDHVAMPGTDESYKLAPRERGDGVEAEILDTDHPEYVFVKRGSTTVRGTDDIERPTEFVFEALVSNEASSFHTFLQMLDRVGVANRKKVAGVLYKMEKAGELQGMTIDQIRHLLKERYKPALYRKIGCTYDGGTARALEGVSNKEAHDNLMRALSVKDGEKMINSSDLGNIGEKWYKARHLDGQVVHSEVRVTKEMVQGLSKDSRRIDHVVKGEDGNLQAVEVKAGEEPVDLKQLDDYVEMQGQMLTKRKAGSGEITKVKYVFLNPKGGATNLERLVNKLKKDNIEGVQIELFARGGETKIINSEALIDMSNKEIDIFVSDTNTWLMR